MVFETLFNVNDISNSIFVDVAKGVPGLVDVLGLDQLTVWSDVVLGAEL